MKVEKLERVAISVKNLDEAIKLFSGVLNISFNIIPYDTGIKRTGTVTADSELGSKEREKRPAKLAISPLGLALVETDPPPEKEGLRSLLLKVANLEQAKVEMETKGITKLAEATLGGQREAIYSPDDCHGVRIALIDYDTPDSMSAILQK